MLVQASQGQSGSAHVVVLGNEKGGSGKSTTALHIAVALLKAGQRVATIDLDCRQQSFTRYIGNRRAWARAHRARSRAAGASPASDAARRCRSRRTSSAEFQQFMEAVSSVEHAYDFIVIDTPGLRQLPDAARAFDGRHAGDADQRQLSRFRRAGHASIPRPMR